MKIKEIFENYEEESNLPSLDLAKQLLPKILAAAQRDYDSWDEKNVDEYAGGGICHIIADSICSVLYDAGIECSPVSCSHEQHVYVAAKFDEGVYTIDIPYYIYETGGGFSWKKLPDIKFEPRDVVFYKVTSDPSEFEQYIGENIDFRRGMAENFADGKHPQDRGDSRRHGIPKNASIAQLKKIRSSDSASPRKKQLAHWQINMRQGRKKK